MDAHSAEEILCWIRSIEEYVKNTRANVLDLETIAIDSGDFDVKEIQAILEFLKNSNISELNLSRNTLKNRMRYLSKILFETKIEKLKLELCDLTYGDLLSLMEIVKETKITNLDIATNQIRFESEQTHEFVSLLMKSHLLLLNLDRNFLSQASILFENLPNTSITDLNLTNVFKVFNKETNEFSPKPNPCLSILVSNFQNSSLKNLNLSTNNIDNAQLKEIGDNLKHSKLEKLDLSNNIFDDTGVDYLVDGLVTSKVTYLNLSHNRIIGGNTLGHRLKDTQLKMLDLSSNEIRDERMFSTPNFIKDASIMSLKLRCCELNQPISALLLRELKFSQLTELDLSYNDLTVANLPALAEVIASTKITNLDVSKIYFGKNLFITLSESLKASKIHHIDVGSNALKSEAGDTIQAIASFLENTKGSSVTSIGLSSNIIKPDDAKIIIASLANSTVTSLDLSRNSIGNDVHSLALHLKFTAITHLNLSWNSIGDQGINALANSLEETQIIELKIINNSITSIGAKALALSFKKTKLCYLYLDFNMIEDDGIEALAEGAENTPITILSVVENPGERKLLIDTVLWKNRTRNQKLVQSIQTKATNM